MKHIVMVVVVNPPLISGNIKQKSIQQLIQTN